MPWSHVQDSGLGSNSGAGATATATFGAGTTTGSILVGALTWTDTATTYTSVTSGSKTASQIGATTQMAASGGSLTLFWINAPTAGTTTVVATLSGTPGGGGIGMYVSEFTPPAGVVSVDAHSELPIVMAGSDWTTGLAATGTAITPVTANDLAITGFTNSLGAGTYSISAGWTALTMTDNSYVVVGLDWQILSGTPSTNATWTNTWAGTLANQHAAINNATLQVATSGAPVAILNNAALKNPIYRM